MIFVAVGVQGWGRSKYKKVAIRRMRHHASSVHRQYIVFKCEDDKAYISDMGSLCTAVGTKSWMIRNIKGRKANKEVI